MVSQTAVHRHPGVKLVFHEALLSNTRMYNAYPSIHTLGSDMAVAVAVAMASPRETRALEKDKQTRMTVLMST